MSAKRLYRPRTFIFAVLFSTGTVLNRLMVYKKFSILQVPIAICTYDYLIMPTALMFMSRWYYLTFRALNHQQAAVATTTAIAPMPTGK